MPEILTKYPDIVLQLLREAGVNCGGGAAQRILTACPPERFCSLPGGELCIYGLADIGRMTQMSAAELAQTAAPQPGLELLAVALLAFVLGAVIGAVLLRVVDKRLK